MVIVIVHLEMMNLMQMADHAMPKQTAHFKVNQLAFTNSIVQLTYRFCKFLKIGEAGFVCDGNRCLRSRIVCDGLVHCKDGSDELPEHCAAVTCPPDKFQCKDSKQCIPRSFLCDGNADCHDKSDEMENCTECPEFRCNNGLCIQFEKVCDGMHILCCHYIQISKAPTMIIV